MDNASIVHVVPLNDLLEHVDTGNGSDCLCVPRIERTTYGAVIVIHNSFDGRENHEHGHRRIES